MRKGRHVIMILCVGMLLPMGGGVPEVEAAVEKSLDRGVEVIAQEIAETLPQDKKPLLAVLDFSDPHDCVSVLGRLTADKLVTKLFKTKRVQVVERGLLKKALAELNFNLSELVDPGRAKQLGKQVGADAIVSGTITDSVSSVEIIARAIAVETGGVLATAEVEIAKDESVKQLVSQTLSCPGNKKDEPLPQVDQPRSEESKQAPPSTTASKPIYENELYRIVVNFLNRIEDKITVVMSIENVTNQPIEIKFGCFPDDNILLDEKGAKWEQKESDSAGIWRCDRYAHLDPKSKVRTSVIFKATGATKGTIFSLIGREHHPRRRLISINDLNLN